MSLDFDAREPGGTVTGTSQPHWCSFKALILRAAPIPLKNMTSKTHATVKNVKKLSVATAAAVALAGGALGTGTAGAQELSSASGIQGRIAQMSSAIHGPGKAQDSQLTVDLPQGANHLDPMKATTALNTPLQAKNNKDITLEFKPAGNTDGTLAYNDGCNAGNATYHFDSAGNLRVGDLAETLALCDDAATADADALKTILQANPAVYQLDENTVALASQGKAIEFVKAEAPKEN